MGRGRRKELEWLMLLAGYHAKSWQGCGVSSPGSLARECWIHVDLTLIPAGLAFSSVAVLVKDADPSRCIANLT